MADSSHDKVVRLRARIRERVSDASRNRANLVPPCYDNAAAVCGVLVQWGINSAAAERYTQTLIQEGYDAVETLPELESKDLDEMGFNRRDRNLVLRGIGRPSSDDELAERHPVPPVSVHADALCARMVADQYVADPAGGDKAASMIMRQNAVVPRTAGALVWRAVYRLTDGFDRLAPSPPGAVQKRDCHCVYRIKR